MKIGIKIFVCKTKQLKIHMFFVQRREAFFGTLQNLFVLYVGAKNSTTWCSMQIRIDPTTGTKALIEYNKVNKNKKLYNLYKYLYTYNCKSWKDRTRLLYTCFRSRTSQNLTQFFLFFLRSSFLLNESGDSTNSVGQIQTKSQKRKKSQNCKK